ncbi:tRNA-specific adenosine-34 deaminase [hydrothermal vent metagenome]|uniref:tRNA-specific adenosine deaminase 2 n=2 Tax=root TaxID=1 RepID=A0A160TE47_9ZZZZ
MCHFEQLIPISRPLNYNSVNLPKLNFMLSPIGLPVADDESAMRLALLQAQQAFAAGEVPVGAVVVLDGVVIGAGFNCPITTLDPSAHAEMVALRDAAKRIGNYRVTDATLYVTVEPCTMCSGLLIHSRIGRLVYGATEPKAGAVESATQVFSQPWLNHRLDLKGGVLAVECSEIMSEFFQLRRDAKKRLKQASSVPSKD